MPEFDNEYLKAELKKFHAIEPKKLSTEGCVSLIEWLLDGVHEDIKAITRDIYQNPNNPDVCQEALWMYKYLHTKTFDIFTMGHASEIWNQFEKEVDIERVKRVIQRAKRTSKHDRVQKKSKDTDRSNG